MDNLQPGQMLGPYGIVEPIGQGGMATVYKAYQASMDRYVAIKVLPSKLAENPEFSGRFQQEARIIANLEHPHILPVFDYGESGKISYMVMRYLEGGSLKRLMEKGRMSLGEIDRVFRQILDGLAYAHAHGVIHRDMKPSNVLVDAQGNAFLTDFGIAKLLEGSTNFTQTDAIIGTPDYISPEQAQGIKVDQRSDLYSLGIMLYEMATGRVPFKADTPLAVIMKHVNEPLPAPSKVRPDIHPAVEQVILMALAKDRDERFATAEEFASAWKSAYAQAAAEPKPTVRVAAPVPVPTSVRPSTIKEDLPPVNPAGVSEKPRARRSSTGLVVSSIAGGCLLIVLLLVGGTFALARNLFNGEKTRELVTITQEVSSLPASQPAQTEPTGAPASEVAAQAITPTGPAEGKPAKFTVTGGDQFNIEIGDEITRDEPGAGAGYLEEPYSLDVYTFTAEAGEEVYFQTIKHPGNAFLTKWRLFDDIGNKLFETCMQCGDIGLLQLERGGTYTLVVGHESDNSTGAYQVKIWEVPDPQEFAVEFGDEITRDVPGPGAGYIETPGVKDIYTFTANPGQVVVLEFSKTPSRALTTWTLLDELDFQVGSSCLQCGNSQPMTLDRGGKYRLVVGSKTDPGVGTYTLKIVAAP